MKKGIFCAHRGFHEEAPENTLVAFEKAVSLGVAEIEFDLWPTLDGQLIVCHDPTVDRTTDGTGSICKMTEEEVRNCDAGVKAGEKFKGEKLPLFEEVLERYAGKVTMNIHIKSLDKPVIESEVMKERAKELSRVYIENRPFSMPFDEPKEVVLQEFELAQCKPYDEETFKKIINLIDKYHCRDSVYITGEKDVLETALKVAPDVSRCCLEGHMNFSIVDNALKYQCSRVQFCKLMLTKSMIEKAHANGIICNLFWSDDVKEAEAFFDMGIDVILTNYSKTMTGIE